jgi:hypothetical protein
MNRRISYLSFIVALAGTCALLATTAQSQLGQPKNYVSLQPTTPGTSQSGHANVSGTSRAGQFVGGGEGLTNVNAAQLGGLASSVFGQLSSSNLWTGVNTFNNAGNSFSGNGAGLTSVNADLLDGLNSTAFLQGVPNPLWLSGSSSPVIRGQNTSSGPSSTGIEGIGGRYGVHGRSDISGGFGVYGVAGTSGNAGVYGLTDSSIGTGVFGHNNANIGNAFGVQGLSESTSGSGVRGIAVALSGNNSGGYFTNESTSGFGVRAIANSPTGYTIGGLFDNWSEGGTGVGGYAISQTGYTRGGAFESSSSNGTGVYARAFSYSGNTFGGRFECNSTSGTSVFGKANNSSGTTFGGSFQSESTTGTAVFGWTPASTGTTFAGKFQSDSSEGYAGHFTGVGPDALYVQNTGIGRGIFISTNSDTAVWANTTTGFASVDARNGSTNGFGVFGYAIASSGTSIGVAGQSNSPSGWGLFSYGNSGATGVKSFRIDHPFDPENKYLLHYSTEMPEPQNAYNGNVVTDINGEAWVQLPDYFEQINKDFKYQLTVVDDTDSDQFVIAKVAKKIRSNQFKIRTNAPNIEVAWEVKAVRNDLWMQKYGAPSEMTKSNAEKGKYQHPELYGQSAERGMNFQQKVRAIEPQKAFPKSMKPMRK